MSKLTYLSGIGNHHQSEAIAGVLPYGQNSPQQAKHGLYTEQLTGTCFLAPRHENLRSWLYRIRPSVMHEPFTKLDIGSLRTAPFTDVGSPTPEQLRWDPIPFPKEKTDFIEGLTTWVGNGSASLRKGGAIHLYAFNAPMKERVLSNADGEFVIIPQEGDLDIPTEFGRLEVAPGEIVVIPRGVKFQVNPKAKQARGYVGENYGAFLRLPNLGPIGSNGLANPRDFQVPTAQFSDDDEAFHLIVKFEGSVWRALVDHSPLDVVGWHGNYYPYKYNLSHFNTINTVSFDHPDPSIFTVLTSPTEMPGVSNMDFIIFPPRWMVAEHSFRPPWYHRNTASEYMGLIYGTYDAKEKGFVPGGGSLHNSMSAHGPDADTYQRASKGDLKPQKIDNTMAFMFESSLVWQPTAQAISTPLRQRNYLECWKGLPKLFKE